MAPNDTWNEIKIETNSSALSLFASEGEREEIYDNFNLLPCNLKWREEEGETN